MCVQGMRMRHGCVGGTGTVFGFEGTMPGEAAGMHEGCGNREGYTLDGPR